MNILDLTKKLQPLGFSEIESEIYIILLQQGAQSGYQIAKMIGKPRSSVYPVLDSLFSKGFIHLIAGDVKIYSARDPEELISRMKTDFNGKADHALNILKDIRQDKCENRFLNIDGFENNISSAKTIIANATSELLINSDYDLNIFHDELSDALSRNVRIIVFSWLEISTAGLPVELYTRYREGHHCGENRLIIIADLSSTLVSGTIENDMSSFGGFYTENRLVCRLMAEHIHFDIYTHKLMNKFKSDLITGDIQLGSILERSPQGAQ